MRRTLPVAVGAIVLLVAAGAWLIARGDGGADEHDPRIPGEGYSPQVEVVNGAGLDGLAAATSRALRRQGIDVVFYGTAPSDSHTVTHIVIRRGDSTAARFVRQMLGFGSIVEDLNAGLLVDVTVLLGRDAPAPSLRP